MTMTNPHTGSDRERAALRRLVAEQVAAAPPTFPWDAVRAHASPGAEQDPRRRHESPKRQRQVRWIASTAAGALVVAGLFALSQLGSDDSPASSPSTPTTGLPATDRGLARPASYPALPLEDPRNDAVSGGYGRVTSGPGAQALVARVNDDSFTDGLWLGVYPDYRPAAFATADAEIVTVDGVDYDVFRETGTPTLTTVVLPGSPAVAVSGVDPLAFVQAAGGIPVVDATTDQAGGAMFRLGALPAGYDVVVEPESLPRQSVLGQINLTSDVQEGPFAEVQVGNPLPGRAMVGTYHRVDVSGATGWVSEEAAHTVVWPVGDGTWALAAGTGSEADVLAFARSLEFIDEASWSARYDFHDAAEGRVDATDARETTPGTSTPTSGDDRPEQTAFETVDATVVGRDPAEHSSAVEVDRGARDGLRVGMPVVNSAGLVGRVTTVYDTTSIVLLTTSPDFAAAAQLRGPDDPSRVVSGVIRGQGPGRPLTFTVPAQPAITPAALGDQALTAGGTSSLAPADIPIGTATGVTHPAPEGADGLQVDIEPNEGLDDIRSVQVILYQPDVEAPRLDLVRIDARSDVHGTTGVVLVFDGELTGGGAAPLSGPTPRDSDRIGYVTQTSGDLASGISVCGDTHWFPPPGNRTVDIFVPSEWFGPNPASDAPVEWDADVGAKIVVCDPHDGFVQISVWGSASGRMEDVTVEVAAETITVDIAPDLTDRDP